jgi:hypothetical protein
MMWIVGGAAAPEAAAENHNRLTTQLDLLASVPDAVRKSFDRIRSIYRQGLFCYDLYTVAGDQARLLIELALQERFVEFYGGTVLFTDRQGNTQTITASSFEEVHRGIRGPDGRPKHWKIQLRNGRPGFQFTGGWLASSGGRARKGCSAGKVTGCATSSASGPVTGSLIPITTWRCPTMPCAPSQTWPTSSASCGARRQEPA